MSFDCWCEWQLFEIRRRLRAFMVESHRRRIRKERDIAYWQRYHALESQIILTSRTRRSDATQ